MSSYKPIDSKREEFRRYLEKAGVMDALTKVLVALYEEPEKPDNALEYIRDHLAKLSPEAVCDEVKKELGDLKKRIEVLEETNERLRERLFTYEPVGEELKRVEETEYLSQSHPPLETVPDQPIADPDVTLDHKFKVSALPTRSHVSEPSNETESPDDLTTATTQLPSSTTNSQTSSPLPTETTVTSQNTPPQQANMRQDMPQSNSGSAPVEQTIYISAPRLQVYSPNTSENADEPQPQQS